MKLGFSVFLAGIGMFTTWLTKSAADGKIDGREWAELGLGIASLLGLSTDLVLPQVSTEEGTDAESLNVAATPDDEDISPKLRNA